MPSVSRQGIEQMDHNSILLIDDSASVREVLRVGLESEDRVGEVLQRSSASGSACVEPLWDLSIINRTVKEQKMRRTTSWHFIGMLCIVGTNGLAIAQAPTGAADLFVPSMSGVTATDYCVGSAGSAICDIQGVSWQFVTGEGDLHTDALGQVHFGRLGQVQVGICNLSPTRLEQIEEWILRRVSTSGNIERLGAFVERCQPPEFVNVSSIRGVGLDAINGAAYVSLIVSNDFGSTFCVVRISGLPTLLGIMLSYQPPSTLSFNVPVRPEGLPGADSFSVYAGDVRTASDLSQAVPLQCTVPAGRPPVPGEHLSVTDPLPDPPAAYGRYYVAAVRHGAQIRAGRSSMGGVLQGRNAAALQGCQ